MTSPTTFLRTKVTVQPVLRLVDLFEESTQYERSWCLPFNSLSFCAKENPLDPSWIDLPEQKRLFFEEGIVHFTTCDTPMRIRYTPANHHCCIHFRYELFPGVDLFSGIHQRYRLDDQEFAERMRTVFAESDPLRRTAAAEAAALEILLKFWPEQLPLDLREMERFGPLLEYIKKNLNSQTGVSDMASFMGWSEGYFSRVFHKVFHITPKQYLLRELFACSLELLNDPRKSIKQIAAELEFSSEFNFSRFIRSCSNHSPSELRRNKNNSSMSENDMK